ncbi:hypothetical protein PBY51_014497 [Eleginops maclovinus]|uniref:Uncharacterized protein n=1 Tax=Eleginops maclovinus TaxID=56733 RepID=A0AAN7WM99_ELEMC|nr:hypothetical protein PBY51_014497 [Eleginops maclovinus]
MIHCAQGLLSASHCGALSQRGGFRTDTKGVGKEERTERRKMRQKNNRVQIRSQPEQKRQCGQSGGGSEELHSKTAQFPDMILNKFCIKRVQRTRSALTAVQLYETSGGASPYKATGRSESESWTNPAGEI